MNRHGFSLLIALAVLSLPFAGADHAAAEEPLRLRRDQNWLVIHAPWLPGEEIRIHYMEAYCRANSTDADWVEHTKIPHQSELLEQAPDGSRLVLLDRLADGVEARHEITAQADHVRFRVVLHNPTDKASEAHWAQPCVRLAAFTGFSDVFGKDADLDDYLPQCFVFVDGQLTRMPFSPWAKEARYTPGQVWCPAHVPRTDVNPRPLSPVVPSNGLIGCFSKGETHLFATAWEPYQELFQGVARCLHSDFRIAGLQPGETKQVRGVIYLLPNQVDALLTRYREDFPEHR